VCDSHNSDEGLLLSVHGSSGGRGIVLLPLGCSGGGGLLPIDDGEVGVAAWHDHKTMVVGGGEP
jgi:hypothetical protein